MQYLSLKETNSNNAKPAVWYTCVNVSSIDNYPSMKVFHCVKTMFTFT